MFKNLINRARVKSPWVLHFDCGSCNGCDIETLACLTPVYDIERFGAINVGNPKHADVLLVTGTVNHRNKTALRTLWEQMPEPKVVVAIGACCLTGGIFRDAYNVVGGADKVIPVDVYVPGCPSKPEAIIDAMVVALGRLATGDTASARWHAEQQKLTADPAHAAQALPSAEQSVAAVSAPVAAAPAEKGAANGAATGGSKAANTSGSSAATEKDSNGRTA